MTEVLAPREIDRVLEIGTGSGYQTAVLARLAREVISIERHASLAAGASAIFEMLGLANIRVVVGDGTEGWPLGAPYQRIIVTAGAPAVPDTLKAQLADGGRLVIPVGPSGHQRLTTIDRRGDEYVQTEGEGCVFVPLVGRHGW
jgi:protein-L-isoaspartate(D-aspartate) O-methyltransferase